MLNSCSYILGHDDYMSGSLCWRNISQKAYLNSKFKNNCCFGLYTGKIKLPLFKITLVYRSPSYCFVIDIDKKYR